MSSPAPADNLLVLSVMRSLEAINPKVATPCLQSMVRHLDYLMQELVVLCLGNKDIPGHVKKVVAKAVHGFERTDNAVGGKPKLPNVTNQEFWDFSEPSGIGSHLSLLPKLVGPQSWTIFNILQLLEDEVVWLQLEPHQWSLISGFRKFERFVTSLSVANDSAERGVKLVEDFVSTTTDENLRQDLMLAVADHRKRFKKVAMTKDMLKKL